MMLGFMHRHGLQTGMMTNKNSSSNWCCVQISMKLRLAQMWDHNGTNMEALGFMYRNYQVLIALDADDNVKGITNSVARSPCAVLHE
jgi:hypothetical protein